MNHDFPPLMKPPDRNYYTQVVFKDGEDWSLSCDTLFCEVCSDCLACYGEDMCIGGHDHEWPEGWQQLARRVRK